MLFIRSGYSLPGRAGFAPAAFSGGPGGGEDDSDMKIVGAPKQDEKPDESEKELERQQRSGNLDKARSLGDELAREIIDEDGVTSFGRDAHEGDGVRRQRRLLLAFVVDYSVNSAVSGMPGHTALGRFYDDLKRDVPDFYEDVRESASFSFYLLCVRDGEDVERNIGSAFAMLAGHEGDKVMAELGEALCYHFRDIVSATISSYHFKA
jgi:hypothetical protein